MRLSAAAHATRSDLERTLCDELSRADVAHEHRSLHFRVGLDSGETARYDPDIVVRRAGLLFLIAPIAVTDQEHQLEIVTRFLESHSEEIVLIVVAPEAVLEHLPPEAYDEAYTDTDAARVVEPLTPAPLMLLERDIERLLYHESGLLGVSGISSDMRELLSSDAPSFRKKGARGEPGSHEADVGDDG